MKTFALLSRSATCLRTLFLVAFTLFALLPCFAQQAPKADGAAEDMGPIGIQMYSLRNYCQINVESGLKLAADLGFKIIEPSSSFDKTPEEYREFMKKYGLYAISKNFGYDQLKTDAGVDEMIRIGKALGVKYVGIAYLPFHSMTEEKMREVIATINHAAERIAAAGLTFTFHNHGKEFAPWENGKENETLFDLLVQQTDPEKVKFEMDVRWVTAGDPVALLKKYPERFCLMHVKCDSGKKGMLLEEGNIDWKAIFDAGKEIGIEAYFLEYDDVRNIIPNTVDNLRYLESRK